MFLFYSLGNVSLYIITGNFFGALLIKFFYNTTPLIFSFFLIGVEIFLSSLYIYYPTKIFCSICLEENRNRSYKLLCGHYFHITCFEEFIINKNIKNNYFECPLCRKPFRITFEITNFNSI